MKTKLIYGFMALFAAVALVACNNDDDDIKPSNVPQEVMTSFNKKFPGSSDVEWEKYGQYYIASFMNKSDDCDAWFASDGNWLMTEYEYKSVSKLPIMMRNAFQESDYASWFVDDVTLYEKNYDDAFCQIEVETPGQPETSIFINAAGSIMNIVPNYDGTITPVTDITLL